MSWFIKAADWLSAMWRDGHLRHKDVIFSSCGPASLNSKKIQLSFIGRWYFAEFELVFLYQVKAQVKAQYFVIAVSENSNFW